MSFNHALCSSGKIPAEPEPCKTAQATENFNHIVTKLSIWRSHLVALVLFKMSRLHLDYKGRAFWENKHFWKQNKSRLSLRLGPFGMLLLLWGNILHTRSSREIIYRERKVIPTVWKSQTIYQASKQPPLRCVGMHFLGNPWWWEWGWRRGEGDLEEKILFLIENPLSWKHRFKM